MQCKLRFPLLQHMISISWYTQHVPRPGPSPPRRFWPLPRPAPHCGEGGVPRPAPSRRFFALPLPAPPRPVKKIASPPIPAFLLPTKGCQVLPPWCLQSKTRNRWEDYIYVTSIMLKSVPLAHLTYKNTKSNIQTFFWDTLILTTVSHLARIPILRAKNQLINNHRCRL